jgi:RNA polymerase sigma factor (sigma-70 family)
MSANTALFSEEAFVERLQSGDRAAFAELYDRYGRSLFGIIFTIVKSEPDAENLLQDAFVKIWRNIGRYDASKGRLYTWLAVIARRRALDFVRSNEYLGVQMVQSAEVLVSMESNSVESQRLDHIGIEMVVGSLDAPLKQVIDFQYFLGYTQQEVADELGMPLGTVKSRTRAALLELRKLLSFES